MVSWFRVGVGRIGRSLVSGWEGWGLGLDALSGIEDGLGGNIVVVNTEGGAASLVIGSNFGREELKMEFAGESWSIGTGLVSEQPALVWTENEGDQTEGRGRESFCLEVRWIEGEDEGRGGELEAREDGGGRCGEGADDRSEVSPAMMAAAEGNTRYNTEIKIWERKEVFLSFFFF
ncbi:unnamed protein product [Cochlearia groenlandica]